MKKEMEKRKTRGTDIKILFMYIIGLLATLFVFSYDETVPN